MKYLKKTLSLLLPVLLLLSCTACGSTQEETEETKTIVVGTNASHAPYAYHVTVDGVDTITGSDIALAKEIADEAGYNLEIKDFSYDELLEQLDLGNLDFIAAAMPDLKDNEDVLCSEAYGENKLTCITTVDASYADAASLAGKTVGILEGTTQTEMDALNLPSDTTTYTQAADELMTSLRLGTIDAAIMPQALAENYMALSSQALTAAFTVSAGDMHIVVRYTNNIFLETVNDIIDDISQAGDMEDWLAEASVNAYGKLTNNTSNEQEE